MTKDLDILKVSSPKKDATPGWHEIPTGIVDAAQKDYSLLIYDMLFYILYNSKK